MSVTAIYRQLSSVNGVSFKSLSFCLSFHLSGEGAANLLDICGVIQFISGPFLKTELLLPHWALLDRARGWHFCLCSRSHS